MTEIVEFLKQLIVIGFEVCLIVGIMSLTVIVASAAIRIVKSKAWG